MEDFEELEFVIPAYTPETMPLDRLLKYLEEISEVVGVAHDMHLIRIEPSSTKPVFKMPTPSARQAREKGASVQRGEGTSRQRAAYQRIRRMVEKDSGEKHASLSDQQGIILDFPPLKEAATISGIRQATSFDGILLRTGGAGTYASLLMQDLAGETVAGFAVQRSLAKSMAHLLYEPIRVHGLGSWDRTPEGEWKLAKMLVQTFEVLEDEGLVDVVRRLQTAPVIWPPDADAQLKAEREQV